MHFFDGGDDAGPHIGADPIASSLEIGRSFPRFYRRVFAMRLDIGARLLMNVIIGNCHDPMIRRHHGESVASLLRFVTSLYCRASRASGRRSVQLAHFFHR